MNWAYEKSKQNVKSENLYQRDHLEDMGIHGRIILK
jgi:hypothetical protein